MYAIIFILILYYLVCKTCADDTVDCTYCENKNIVSDICGCSHESCTNKGVCYVDGIELKVKSNLLFFSFYLLRF